MNVECRYFMLGSTSINNIWRCFSSPRPQHALAILPLDQSEKDSSNDNHGNELLTEGRLRAVTECQRKVNEIIKECRRVNMRYRDRDWDLTMFDLGEISGPDTEPNAPGAVKRVHEIFSLPTFMKNVDGGDVKQGKLSNCWFVAGLTALANLEYGLTQACAAHDIASVESTVSRNSDWLFRILDDVSCVMWVHWTSPRAIDD
ncbi:hypothetical protein IWW34DRAFT_824668 [Fusarium oxysporum f. sp. albedinis]|nr:hypothetical protein IWW34DRAFT_824668 [Fusarium oxysporum f. sp. albedinis]